MTESTRRTVAAGDYRVWAGDGPNAERIYQLRHEHGYLDAMTRFAELVDAADDGYDPEALAAQALAEFPFEFTCEDARDALLYALPAPDRRGDGEIDLEDGWVVTADQFGGGPGLTVTAPTGERFVVVVFREGDARAPEAVR